MNTNPRYDLLREAYAVVNGIPDNVIALDAIIFKLGPSLGCGTICCAAGWLAQYPKFRELGLGLDVDSKDPVYGTVVTFWGQRFYNSSYGGAMSRFFCIPVDDAKELFAGRDCSELDDLIDNRGATDKEVWLRRMRTYFEQRGVKL